MKNKKIVFVIVGIIVLAGVFYGGMAYGKSQTGTVGVNGANAQNRTGQFSRNGSARTTGGGFVSGEVLSKDANSVTVKLNNNDPTGTSTTSTGSKIIFFDTSTTVSKMATGSINDLITGTQVSITGTTNPDGSVTAKSIQVRPQVRPSTPPIQ